MTKLLSPGHTYAVNSTSGCTVIQDGVSIQIEAPQGVFVATSEECEISDDNAEVQFIF